MIHLAIATRGINGEEFPCDIIGPFYYEDDIVQKSLPIIPGMAKPNDVPGLGVDLDDEKIAKYRIE
jgi:muconate cycloisomerase